MNWPRPQVYVFDIPSVSKCFSVAYLPLPPVPQKTNHSSWKVLAEDLTCIIVFFMLFFPAGRSCLTEHARKGPGRELHIGSERGLDYSVWSGVRHNERRRKRNPRCSMNKWISIRALQWTLCYILEVFYESSSITAHLYDDVTRIMVVVLPNFKPRGTEHEPFVIALSTLDPFSTK